MLNLIQIAIPNSTLNPSPNAKCHSKSIQKLDVKR
jgi:hypothetical protein